MDVTTLAQDLVAFLIPFLPYLSKVGEGLVSGTGEMLSNKAWGKAGAVWRKLKPKVDAKPDVQQAVQNAITTPQSEDVRSTLCLQLVNLLTEDQSLAESLAQLLDEAKREGLVQNIEQRGKYNINIGKAGNIEIGDKPH